MIQAREEASKDAPTEEVKNNVTKIYNEFTSGGVFSSLTGLISGGPWWRSATSAAGNTNTAGPSSAVSAAPPAFFSSGNPHPQAQASRYSQTSRQIVLDRKLRRSLRIYSGNPATSGPSSSAVSVAPPAPAPYSSKNPQPPPMRYSEPSSPFAGVLNLSLRNSLRMYASLPLLHRRRQLPHSVPASYGEVRGLLTQLRGQFERKKFEKEGIDAHVLKVEMSQMFMEILKRFHQNLINDSETRKEFVWLTDYVLHKCKM